jgi:hypothetical protein
VNVKSEQCSPFGNNLSSLLGFEFSFMTSTIFNSETPISLSHIYLKRIQLV